MVDISNYLLGGSWFSTVTLVAYIINFFLAITIIFLERKNPSATLAWIMVLVFLPIIGAIFYFFLSQNIVRRKIFELTEEEEMLLTNSLYKQRENIQNGSFEYVNDETRKWSDLIKLNQTYGRAYLTQDNKVEALTDGKEMFRQFLKDIGNAKETINIMPLITTEDITEHTGNHI